MALTKRVFVDKLEINESLLVSVREQTTIVEDDVPISSSFHRYVLSPGDSLDTQPPLVSAVCRAAWETQV